MAIAVRRQTDFCSDIAEYLTCHRQMGRLKRLYNAAAYATPGFNFDLIYTRSTNMDAEVEQYLASQPHEPLPEDIISFRNISHDIEKAEVQRLGPPSSRVNECYSSIPMRDGYVNTCKVFRPASKSLGGKPVAVLFHGGGFSVGSPEQYTLIGRALVELLDCVVIAASYRLAPEYAFPTGVLDAWDTVKYVAANGPSVFSADPSLGFIIGGASSGANLAAVVTQLAKDHKLSSAPTGQYLTLAFVLWDSIVPSKYNDQYTSIKQNTNDPIQTLESLHAILQRYNPDFHSPYFSPLNSTSGSSGLPPAYIQVCGLDPMRDDGLIYNEILKENGVATRLDEYSGFPHGWWLFMPRLQSSLKATVDTVKGIGWLLGSEVGEPSIEQYLRGKVGPESGN